jgi:ACS family D-galactonate transporter-like MFS transporter
MDVFKLQSPAHARENSLPSRMPTSPSQSQPLTGKLWRVLILLGLSIFISYIDRSNLSIAAPLIKDELHLSASQLGLLLSSFFWTYAFLQLISGWLVDRLNVNWVFAGGFFLWSVATIVTGMVHGFFMLLLLRLLLGVGESVAYPSYSKIIALHYREEHRGIANSIISAGLALGPGFGLLAGGLLISRFGWRAFFVFLGLLSLSWLIPWLAWMPPAKAAIHVDKIAAPSYAALLLQRSAWGTIVAQFGYNYVSYFLLTWLPFYLVRDKHFSIAAMAKIGATGYVLSAFLALFCGWLSDHLIRSGRTPTRVRKPFVAGGLAGAGVLLFLSAISPPAWNVPLLILGIACQGISSSNIWAISQTLAGPYAAGRWTGLQNGSGNLAGIVAPALTGFILDRTGHFEWPFALAALVALAGASSWLFIVGPVRAVGWPERPAAHVATL